MRLFLICFISITLKLGAQCTFSITTPVATASLMCGAMSVYLTVGITGPTTSLVYQYTQMPPGTLFQAVYPDQSLVQVNQPGMYVYNVTNTVTSCQLTGTINVLLVNHSYHINSITAPSCSTCCDGVVNLNAGILALGFTVTSSSGTVFPNTNIQGICNGSLSVCFNNNKPTCYTCYTLAVTPASIKEYSLDNSLSIFPNPTAEWIELSVDGALGNNAKLRIINLLGEEIFVTPVNSNQEKISIKGIPTGLYYCVFSDENRPKKIKRLVIQ